MILFKKLVKTKNIIFKSHLLYSNDIDINISSVSWSKPSFYSFLTGKIFETTFQANLNLSAHRHICLISEVLNNRLCSIWKKNILSKFSHFFPWGICRVSLKSVGFWFRKVIFLFIFRTMTVIPSLIVFIRKCF